MGICINQWRVAVGRWYNFSFYRPLSSDSKKSTVGYWCFTLLNCIVLNTRLNNCSFTLITLLILMIISGTVHPNPGPNEPTKKLKLSHVNMRSLCPQNTHKIDDIYSALCIKDKSDIIAVTETWLDQSVTDQSIELTDYHIFRKDRDRNGGGVALYFSHSIPARQITDFDGFNLELLAVETKLNNKTIIVLCCYRPPSKRKQDIDNFLSNFEHVLSLLLVLNPECFIILGDFNDRCIAWDDSHHQSELGTKFYNLLKRFNLFQMIDELTHVSERYHSLLDLIITDAPAYIDKSGVGVPIGDPYHCYVYCQLTIKYNKDKCYQREVWNYDRADFKGLNLALQNAPWNVLEMFDDVNDASDYFTKLLLETTKDFIPFRIVKINPRDKPWMTSQVKHAFRIRDKLHKKWKKSCLSQDLENYKRSRHRANYAKSLAKLNHFNRIGEKLADPNTSSKEYWHLVKLLYGTKIDAGIPPLKDNDTIYSTAKEKADLLNRHFASKSRLPLDNIPVLPVNVYQTDDRLSEIIVTESDIQEAIKSMKIASANGPDNISNRLLKEVTHSIAKPLKSLLNLSLQTSSVPVKWKEAHVTPVFKSGDRQDKVNYRPISLLSNIGKLLERIVFKQLYKFCESRGLLTWRNSGYKRLDSTVNQMIYISHKIYEALSNGKEVCFVSLDATAAFDRVWHDGLIHKLKNKGISGKLLAWLTNYLVDRKQRVVIKGNSSDWHENKAGVPQGSILGPLLFLIYVDDIVNNIESQILLFADDTSLFEIIDDPATFIRINNDLEKLNNWAQTWLVTFNPKKTKYMIFSKKLTKDVHPPLILANKCLDQVSQHCQLGIVLHEDMSWNSHITKICDKAGKRLSAMIRIADKLNKQTKLNIYISFIRPILEYGNVKLKEELLLSLHQLTNVQSM